MTAQASQVSPCARRVMAARLAGVTCLLALGAVLAFGVARASEAREECVERFKQSNPCEGRDEHDCDALIVRACGLP